MKRRITLILGGLAFFYAAYFFYNHSGLRSNKNQKVHLQFNLAPHTTYHYTISNEQEVQSSGADMSLSSTIEVDYRRLNDSAGFQILQSTISRVAARVQSQMMNLSFDSKDGSLPSPSQSAVEPIFKLLDKPYLIYLNKKEGITQVRTTASKPSSIQEDSLLIQAIGNSFDFYPAHPVTVGDQWKTTIQLPVQGIHTSLKTTYTLQAVHGDTAILKAQATLEAPERDLVMNRIPMKVNMSGRQNGTLRVLMPEGRLLQASFSSNITGLFKAQGLEKKSITQGTSTITGVQAGE